ncbi:MAG: plasma-membrane proton-efflux P-type ATPase [Betaproteobacteria bacterium]|nr:plasma-membrane proton-efflux P-type ATPase [Betaproteobacteria bacterium]
MINSPSTQFPQPTPKAAETPRTLGSNRETGLTSAEAKSRLDRQGANEVPEKKHHPLLRFLRKFWGLSAWMIELIALLSFILHKQADLLVALSLLLVNAILSFLQEQRASAAVAALRRQLNVTARVLRDGEWQTAPARTLVTGDVVRVRAGDFVPADLQVLDGGVRIDQSALTGESREVEKIIDETLYSGSTVRLGEATGVVTATGMRTYFGRTTQLVQSAQHKLHVEEVVARIVRWLFLIVGSLVAVTLLASGIEGLPLLDTLPIALVLLMSAVPVALPVMFTVSMALGSMELSRRGVLITQLSAVEDAATMDVLCADKTGTLTLNRLSLAGTLPQPGFTEVDMLRTAAFASNEANADPIDLAFLRAARERGVLDETARTLSFQPFSAATRRTEAVVELDGRSIHCMKGALRTVAEAAGLDAAAVATLEEQANAEAQKGMRVLAVARADGDGALRLVGLAYLYDAPRPDSRRLIDELRGLGIKVKMLTGDALPVAREMARLLGLGEIARAPELRAAQQVAESRAAGLAISADGFAEVFPEDKFLVVEHLQAAGHVVGMTGDGVNDAPALRQAEVGIAVSGATDVAKGAASAVLTREGLADIIDLVKNGRAIYQRVLTWVVNKISRTILKAGFVVIAFLATGKFVISALAMVLLVFMTDFVKIALATDNVRPSQNPETWNIGPLVGVAVVLGLLMLVEALGLLAFGWHRFALDSGDGCLQTFTFQTLLFFALFSIISIRERRAFWASRPSTLLATALGADAVVGALIGVHGMADLRPLPIEQSGLIFLSAGMLVLGPNDLLKTLLTARISKNSRQQPRS